MQCTSVTLPSEPERRSTSTTSTTTASSTSDCPTVYTLAIVFGLLDDTNSARAGERLAELVRKSDHRISTGFAGTPFITDALTTTGHLDDAYELLLQRECPSWLYPVTMGATTVWERWDSMLPDGTINPGEMTSFNHYALGAVADWIHRTIGGVAPLEPGYTAVRIAPRPGGGLTWARTALESRRGRIEVEWRQDDDDLLVEVLVPEGVRAVMSLPGSRGRDRGTRQVDTSVPHCGRLTSAKGCWPATFSGRPHVDLTTTTAVGAAGRRRCWRTRFPRFPVCSDISLRPHRRWGRPPCRCRRLCRGGRCLERA